MKFEVLGWVFFLYLLVIWGEGVFLSYVIEMLKLYQHMKRLF